MYTSIQSSKRWNSTIPMVCLLLLSVIFLTAAATAVISLISVYAPTKHVDSVSSINTQLNQKTSQLRTNTGNKDLGNMNTNSNFENKSNKRERRQSSTPTNDQVTGNISLIMPYWANLSPYQDNDPDAFGVTDIGLPDGCQVEQVFLLHRHAARYPSNADTKDINEVVAKLKNTTGNYIGPLSFFNSWVNQLGSEQLLPLGTSMEYQSGVETWRKYGRLLYNAAKGQNYYNATGQTKPILRCNNVPRVNDSAHAWADGFFTLYNQTTKYNLTVIPAGSGLNNTLAGFISCANFLDPSLGIFNIAHDLYDPIEEFETDTIARIQQYVPSDVTLDAFDVFIMQTLCPFEYVAYGSSDFCSLFTLKEWQNFRYTYDLYLYNGFSFGSPLGRAIGLGVVEELIARLKNQTITVSDSSVNTTYDGNTQTFPLGQKFYLDMSHDFIILGMLTAMSIDYFREDLSSDSFNPTPEDRHFKSNTMVPYAARLITEKIGCTSANPTTVTNERILYSPTQYGYSAASATNKFIRMRLNSGILPLSTIPGGYCSNRTDGLCPLSSFLASQANVTAQANYQKLCFTRFVYNASLFNGDGNYFP
jgi:hypothetical protein